MVYLCISAMVLIAIDALLLVAILAHAFGADVSSFFKRLGTRWDNLRLIAKYPFLAIRTGRRHRRIYLGSTWLDDMPDGWRKAFGLQMCEELREALVKDKALRGYGLDEVKSKYGTLRWYDYGGTEKTDFIVQKYELLSMCYCELCGEPARFLTHGWVSYVCKDCASRCTLSSSRLATDDIPTYSESDGKGGYVDVDLFARYGIDFRKAWGLGTSHKRDKKPTKKTAKKR